MPLVLAGPVAGLLLGAIDGVVDLERMTGVHREDREQALQTIRGGVAGDE